MSAGRKLIQDWDFECGNFEIKSLNVNKIIKLMPDCLLGHLSECLYPFINLLVCEAE